MTVYEMIQELSQYQADAEVRFCIDAKIAMDIESFIGKSDDEMRNLAENMQFFDYAKFKDSILNLNENEVTINITN